MSTLRINDLDKCEELDESAMRGVAGGWLWSGLLVVPFAAGVAARYAVDKAVDAVLD